MSNMPKVASFLVTYFANLKPWTEFHLLQIQIFFSSGPSIYQCYFIIRLQDRYGISDSIGGAQLTMEEVWIIQTGNFTLNGLDWIGLD